MTETRDEKAQEDTAQENQAHEIDALVRAASDRETDETAIYYKVIGRLDERPAIWTAMLPRFGPNLAAAGFASLMVAAGFMGYALPDLANAGTDEQILALAFGLSDGIGDPLVPAATGLVE